MPPRLYDDLAHLWPVLSPPEDYEAEAAAIGHAITPAMPADRRPTLLELGAGGGHTLVHLADRFDCTADDLSPSMLNNCRRLVPSARAIVGDMRSLRLDETFDAVLVHDAIDYMTTPEDARAALVTVAAHLRPGGVAVIAPTYVADDFEDGDYEADQAHADGLTLTYLSYARRRPGDPYRLELHLAYVIDRGGDIEVVHDAHECGLFALDQWHRWIEEAGLQSNEEGTTVGAWHGLIAQRPGDGTLREC
ncbi:MAG: class I SAM-dependent methyltransferase [Phycisphaeraceae bacterium]